MISSYVHLINTNTNDKLVRRVNEAISSCVHSSWYVLCDSLHLMVGYLVIVVIQLIRYYIVFIELNHLYCKSIFVISIVLCFVFL